MKSPASKSASKPTMATKPKPTVKGETAGGAKSATKAKVPGMAKADVAKPTVKGEKAGVAKSATKAKEPTMAKAVVAKPTVKGEKAGVAKPQPKSTSLNKVKPEVAKSKAATKKSKEEATAPPKARKGLYLTATETEYFRAIFKKFVEYDKKGKK